MNSVSRKALASVAMAAASLLVLSGCASPKAGAGYIECGVSDEGSWKDKSFNESVMDGLVKAQDEFGVTLKSAESKSQSDFEPNLQSMVDAKCNVIVAVGFNLIDAVNKFAVNNPTMNFVTIDGYVKDAATMNLKPVNYNVQESSYLAGYAAAAYSTSKVVGVYGGMQIDAVTAFMDGFYYGAQAWAMDNSTKVKVVGWNPTTKTGDFIGGFTPNDPAGKTIAAGQLAQGADVLLPVAGDQFGALSQAIKDAGSNAKMIGVDKNWTVSNPEYADLMLTSIEKRMTTAVYDIVKAGAVDKTAFSGEAYIGTLANDGVGISDTTFIDGVTGLKAKLDELKAGIIAGTVNPLK